MVENIRDRRRQLLLHTAKAYTMIALSMYNGGDKRSSNNYKNQAKKCLEAYKIYIDNDATVEMCIDVILKNKAA